MYMRKNVYTHLFVGAGRKSGEGGGSGRRSKKHVRVCGHKGRLEIVFIIFGFIRMLLPTDRLGFRAERRFIFIFVCIYVFMYTYICLCVYTYGEAPHAYICICVYVYMYICICVYIHTAVRRAYIYM